MEFFSEKLPDGFEEDYDVEEVILEVQGHHKSAKKFDKVIDFVNLIKKKYPDLYKKSSLYSDGFLINYYAFHDNNFELEKILVEASAYAAEKYDIYIPIFKTLWFYHILKLLKGQLRTILKQFVIVKT